MLWVRKHQPLSDMRRCDEHMNILRACCIHLDDIYRFVQEIRDGVCSVGDVHNPRYRLPKALVVAFRKLILYLVYMSHVIDLVTKRSESWTSPNWMHVHDRDITEKVMKLTYIGNSIEDAVYQGKIDLTVMLRTQDYTQSIKRYEAVGPQYILIMVLSNLQFGVECKDLVEVYKEYIARLVSTFFPQSSNMLYRTNAYATAVIPSQPISPAAAPSLAEIRRGRAYSHPPNYG